MEGVQMITGKTKRGFEYAIDEADINNMEFLDALSGANDGDPLQASKVLRLLLGDKQRKALYDSLRDEKGRVPIDAVMEEVKDILANDGAKNS